MSYILDALKRADTERERERGHVPGLHSQNLPGGLHTRDRKRLAQRSSSSRLLVAGLLIGALLAAYAGWSVLGRAPAEDTRLIQGPGIPSGHGVTDAASSTPATTPLPAPVAVAPPAATNQPPDLPILAPPPPAPPATPAAANPSRTTPATAAAGSKPGSLVDASSSTAAAAAQPIPAEAPVRRFADLPADFRARLPQVNISGSTYSSNPAQRTLIANGKMVQEGEDVAPGLKLETIGPRNAVLSFEGTRYSIGY